MSDYEYDGCTYIDDSEDEYLSPKGKSMNKLKQDIIIINGIGESGKDEFIKIISEYIDVFNWSSIDTIKAMADTWFNCDQDNKTPEARKLWSKLKEAWIEFNNGPFHQASAFINAIDKEFNGIIFLHIREPEEIDKIKEKFLNKCRTLLIKRKDNKYIPNNKSDQLVCAYEYDDTIYNDGDLKDLKIKAATWFLKLIGERE